MDPSKTPFPLNPESRERLRARSKALFGNRDRLEVAVAVAASKDGLVNATDISWEIGLPNTRVRSQLIAFREAGLLETVPRMAGKRWYLRRSHPFWQACEEIFSEWRRDLEEVQR